MCFINKTLLSVLLHYSKWNTCKHSSKSVIGRLSWQRNVCLKHKMTSGTLLRYMETLNLNVLVDQSSYFFGLGQVATVTNCYRVHFELENKRMILLEKHQITDQIQQVNQDCKSGNSRQLSFPFINQESNSS